VHQERPSAARADPHHWPTSKLRQPLGLLSRVAIAHDRASRQLTRPPPPESAPPARRTTPNCNAAASRRGQPDRLRSTFSNVACVGSTQSSHTTDDRRRGSVSAVIATNTAGVSLRLDRVWMWSAIENVGAELLRAADRRRARRSAPRSATKTKQVDPGATPTERRRAGSGVTCSSPSVNRVGLITYGPGIEFCQAN